jgi:anti-sigma regulatory factor (Ser/Thr protein kinase)
MKTFTSTLPRATDSVRVARQLVDVHSAGMTAARREDAGLMVSELVTNALRHGRGAITMGVTAGSDDLTIEVADEGHGTVELVPAPGPSGGWGLRIVDELADAWGAHEGSTRVWFRLLLGPP